MKMFKFKAPSQKTREIMSKVALGEISDVDFEQSAINKIKDLTGHENVKITTSGNNSIFIALSAIEGDIIIPDQGGWHGFKQIAKFLNKNIITLKTDLGLINPKELDDLEFGENSALIFTSFAGYTAEQDTKAYQNIVNPMTLQQSKMHLQELGIKKIDWENIQTLFLHPPDLQK